MQDHLILMIKEDQQPGTKIYMQRKDHFRMLTILLDHQKQKALTLALKKTVSQSTKICCLNIIVKMSKETYMKWDKIPLRVATV